MLRPSFLIWQTVLSRSESLGVDDMLLYIHIHINYKKGKEHCSNSLPLAPLFIYQHLLFPVVFLKEQFCLVSKDLL
jgi:hypothetical protein